MTKMKTPRVRAYKMLWALPATALLLLAFAQPAYVMDPKINNSNLQTTNSDEVSIKVEGKVVDEMGNPLQDASVVLYGTTVGTVTDQYGKFSIEMKKTDKICISYVGFATVVKDFNLLEQKDNSSTIFTMIKGVLNLNIDKIIQQGKPLDDPKSDENQKLKNEEFYITVEELPEYPGGMYALAKEIKEITSKFKLSGKIEVGLTVDKTGKNTDIYILGKVETKVQDDLIKFFLELKKWDPGKQRGKAVPVSYNLTINQ